MISPVEAVYEPEASVIDAHHHLWKKNEEYLFPELMADLSSGHNVLATVYVEGGSLHRPINAGGTMYRADGPDLLKPVGETEFANGIGAMAASGLFGETRACAGVIGFVDLPLGPAVRPALEEHMRLSRFRGVRHIAAWHDDPRVRNPVLNVRPGLLADEGFREGLRLLASLDLIFETTIFHPQLLELADAARAIPQLTIVVCHLGYPLGVGPYEGKPAETFAHWQANMRELSTCPNVVIKVGGLLSPRCALTPATSEGPLTSDRLAAAWHPYVDACVAMFGPDRCMFESNFPVDGKFIDYRALWNTFKKLSRFYTPEERGSLLSDTARRIYRLDL